MPKTKTPPYTRHKGTGQGKCRIGRKDFYFGPFESPVSRAKYDEFIGHWLAKQEPNAGLTIDDLAMQFLVHADLYYRHPDGTPTGESRNLRDALRPLVALFGDTPVISFGPRRLKLVRDQMIADGMARTNINRQVHRVRRLFSWGVENELVDTNLYIALKQVRPLSPGRSEAVETNAVEPVSEAVVNATLPHLTSVLQAMVRLQLLTGARPAEICMLRPCDVTIRTDGLWSYQPRRHKTAWKGKSRIILLGPLAQEILRPFLEREAEAFCFSPIESEIERSVKRRANRKTPMTPSQQSRKAKGRTIADRYAKDSYGKAIRRACRLRKPIELRTPRSRKHKERKAERETRLLRLAEWERENVWSPNRLRHLRATTIREDFGMEAASAVLGHSGLKITETYAARNDKAAAEVMRQIG